MPEENPEIEQVKSDLKGLREEITALGQRIERRGGARVRAENEALKQRIGASPLVSAFTAFSLGFLTGRWFSR